MKKLSLMLLAVVLIFAGSFTFVGCSAFTDATGVGDGKVSLVESVAIDVGVQKTLDSIPSMTVKKGLHLISGELLGQIDSNELVTVKLLDKYLTDYMDTVSDQTRDLMTAELRDTVSRMKKAIVTAIGIDSEDDTYMVAIRAVLLSIYQKTEAV